MNTGKFVVSSFVSLDGVVESPMVWASPFFDDECKEYASRNLTGVDYFLAGRASYELFSARWPQIHGDYYIDRLNSMKKLVVSRSLHSVTWNASLIKGDVAAELDRIKQGGANLLKYGITQLDATLLAHGLVDEYHIWLMPTRVGTGKRAFQDVDASLLALELLNTHRFSNGVAVLNYGVRKNNETERIAHRSSATRTVKERTSR